MELSFDHIEKIWSDFIAFIPNIALGLLFILISFLAYKIVIWMVRRILKFSKTEKLDRLLNENELFENSNFKINTANLIIGLVKILMVLIILIVGADFLNLSIVSDQIGQLLGYIPRFLSGLLIFAVGIYLASQARKYCHSFLKSLDTGSASGISSIVFYVILIFVLITALNQIGINTEMISNNLSYVIGAALISLTLAIGLGSRDIAYRLILGYYTKKNLEPGMRIQIDENIGIIESIDNISLILKTDHQKIVFPIKKIANKKIIVIENH